MKHISLVALFALLSCAPTRYLVFFNGTTHSVVVNVTSQALRDTIGYQLAANSSDSLIATAFGKANTVDQAELRTIIVRDTSGRIEQILRMSASYLIEKDWSIAYPIIPPCDSCFRKLERASMSTDAYHLAQDLYNSRSYVDCIRVASAGANLDAARSRRTSQDRYLSTDYNEGYARYNGYLLMVFLSAKKTRNESLAQLFWDKIESESPHIARYLKQYDVECSQ